MILHAVLGNPNHPEYGVATIPFPIPHDQYAHCMELLEALEIGDALKADCQVEEIDSFYSVLKRTEMLPVKASRLLREGNRIDKEPGRHPARIIWRFNMTVDINLWVTATILRELRNNGLITQKEAEKILSRVAKQTGATLIISV